MDKKGVSIMIGYVLLVAAAIVMSAVVYQWMKTYVPKDNIECDSGVSITFEDIECVKYGNKINLTLNIENNGLFSLAGIFVRADDNENGISDMELTEFWEFGGSKSGNSVLFFGSTGGQNGLEPNGIARIGFSEISKGNLYNIEIVPFRYQEVDNKLEMVVCGNAKINEELNCVGQDDEE